MVGDESQQQFRKKGDLGIPVVISIFVLASVVGFVVFKNYIRSEKAVTLALTQLQEAAPRYSIEECAQKNMDWYLHCDSMQQICDDTVTRMMKICLVNGDKSALCSIYGKEIYGYNFGYKQCQPYFKNRSHKKACADTWQTVADFCKATFGKSNH